MGSSIRKLFNDELIIFIGNVLKVCSGIRKVQKRVAGETVCIQAQGSGEIILYDVAKRNFAENLLNYVFCATQESQNVFELRSVCENSFLYETIHLEKIQKNIVFKEVKEGIDFARIREVVSQQFMETAIRDDLIAKLHELELCIAEINLNEPFLHREFIEKYWLKYVDILVFLIHNEHIISTHLGRKEILKPLLNFCDVDTIANEETSSVSLSLFSPVSLYLIMIIYDKLEQYLGLETREDEEDLEIIYHEVFLKQILHAYRWFLVDEKQNIFHAAISPFVEKRSDEHELLIPVHKLEAYNSYEGIRELRLAEKIIFELDNWEGLKNVESMEVPCYKVAILGDLQKQPVEELGDYLSKIILKGISLEEESQLRKKTVKIKLDIYTKTQYDKLVDCFGDDEIYSYAFHQLDDVLQSRGHMERILDSHELLFMLDNVDLYNKIIVEEYYNPEFYKQRLKYYNYEKCLQQIKKQPYISYSGMFRELHETLVAYLYSGKWGRFKKTANDNLLRYLENKINNSESKKAIYVYVSDLEAFYDIYCNDRYFIRKEQYSDKEIGIIRYSTRKEAVLKNCENAQYVLSFNMWQFVKHIVIGERQYFLTKLLPGMQEECDLKQIHIGILYDKWREKLVLDYYLETEKMYTVVLEKAIEKFISNTLIPLLNDKRQCLYSEYINKSVCSFLYGNVANVEDMLFLHLYREHRDLIGDVEFTMMHNPELVKRSINRKFKYSFKRFYNMAMQTYDISASEYIGQYKTVEMIKKSNELKKAWQNEGDDLGSAKSTKDRVFEQIVTACENLEYTNSYLYSRCKGELERG